MMGPKFWQLYRKEGLMRAIIRGRPYRPTHEKAGFGDELAPLVGTDEYADSGHWFPTPKKISPAWHGWMHYMYDEPPRVSLQ